MAWSEHVESTGDIPKNDWTKGRGFNESEITNDENETKQSKLNPRERQHDINHLQAKKNTKQKTPECYKLAPLVAN